MLRAGREIEIWDLQDPAVGSIDWDVHYTEKSGIA